MLLSDDIHPNVLGNSCDRTYVSLITRTGWNKGCLNTENRTGLAQIARLGPALWMKVTIRALGVEGSGVGPQFGANPVQFSFCDQINDEWQGAARGWVGRAGLTEPGD